jgi:PAS domain S-box-containing protein
MNASDGSFEIPIVPKPGRVRCQPPTENDAARRFEALPAAVYTTDTSGKITFYNRAAAELWGCEPELGKSEWCGSWRLYWPDGRPMPHGECPMAVALKEERAIRGGEAIAERPDGTRVPFLAFPTPLFDENGELTGAINTLIDITEHKRAEEMLRENNAQLSIELDATQQLQSISSELIHEQGIEALYDKLVEAAAAIMGSDYASMQMLYPQRGSAGELRLLAFRGFDPEAATFWEWVRADSGCTCGEAMRTGQRAIAPDVATCDFMAGTDDQTAYLRAGIHAAQSTPLISRSGRLLGMLSTHWRKPHQPKESGLRRFDILARQAADLMERKQAETALRRQTDRLEALNRIAKMLSSDLDLERIVQTVTDGATKLSGAKFGAFFYNVTGDHGEQYQLLSLSGAPRGAFEKFGLPRNTAVFEPIFRGTGVIRSDDIRVDPRYGKNAPHYGMPKGHLSVVSYLAVPVISRTGEVHGGLFFGHDQPGVFSEETEEIVTGIAAHAAIAIDNGRLLETAKAEIEQRRRSERDARHLASIVDSSNDAIVSTDVSDNIVSWNGGAERLFGYSFQEVAGKPVTMLIPTDCQAEEAEILQRIRRGESVEHYETVRRRKDGSRVEVSVVVSPIVGGDGRTIGASRIARDITSRRRVEAMQAAHRSVLELTVQDEPIGRVLDTLVRTVEAQSDGDMLGSILLLDGFHLRHGAGPSLPEAYNAAIDGIAIGPSAGSCGTAVYTKKPVYVSDIAIDPLWIDFRELALYHGLRACWSTPIVSSVGEVLGTFAMYYRDVRTPSTPDLELVTFVTQSASLIIERRRAQEGQVLLLKEMDHRIKNLFAVAGGIVTLSARGATSTQEMANKVRERLGALSRAHNLVRPAIDSNGSQSVRDVTLRTLVETVISPYLESDPDQGRIVINGSELVIGADAATSIALVLHELATNAAKYGALSLPRGRVHIGWSAENGELSLRWQEYGGPHLSGTPTSEGFGSLLARQSIEGQLGGKISRNWRSDGLIVDLVAPLERLTK